MLNRSHYMRPLSLWDRVGVKGVEKAKVSGITDYRHSRGFNLPELIVAIVLIGIVGGLMAPVIKQSIDSYFTTRGRTELTAKGRLALEQLARAVRQAVPNSLEVVTSGGSEGIQFLSARTGGRYVSTDDGFTGAFTVLARRFAKGISMSELYILDTIVLQPNDRLILGNTSPGELRSGNSAVLLTGVVATANVPDSTSVGQVLQFGGNSFLHDSPSNHFVISNATHEIGLLGDTLRWHKSTGMSSYDTNGDWGVSDPLLMDGVSSLDFSYTPGNPYANGVLRVDLELTDSEESIRLYQEIQIRNTP